MNITNNLHLQKQFFSFWSIKNSYFLLSKINYFLIVLFCFPILGYIAYFCLIIPKIKLIRKNIFSKILRFDFFIKNLYYSLIIPFLLSILILAIFYFLSIDSIICDSASIDFFYLCIVTCLPIFYVSHIFFVILTSKSFNIRIQGIKNNFLGLYKSNIWKESKQLFISNEIDNKKQDVEDKKFFLERFYKKGLRTKIIKNIVKNDLNLHDNRSSVNFIKSLNLKEYVKYRFSFFIHLKNKFNRFNEYDDDAQAFYKDYLNNVSREYYPSYDVFKSVSWTDVYLKKLDFYVFKKYLILFIYFVLSCSFFCFIFSYTVIFANITTTAAGSWVIGLICLSLVYLGFVGLYSLIFWLIWVLVISKYIRYLDLYCLRSTYLKIQKLNEMDIDNFIVNSISQEDLVINSSEKDLFDNELKTLDNQKDLFIVRLNSLILNNNKIFEKKVKNYNRVLDLFSKFTNFTFSVLYLLLYVYLCCIYAYNSNYYIVGYVSYAFIGLMVISTIVEISAFLVIAKIKKMITLFNILYNQKLLYPYFTTKTRLPFILPVFLLNYLGKGYSSGNIAPSLSEYAQYDFILTNLWNFDEKKGFNSLDEKESFEHFFGDVEQLRNIVSNNDVPDLCSGNLNDQIYSKKFDLTDKVLERLNEYPM